MTNAENTRRSAAIRESVNVRKNEATFDLDAFEIRCKARRFERFCPIRATGARPLFANYTEKYYT